MDMEASDIVVVWNWYRHRLVEESHRRNPPIVWMKDYLRKRRHHGAFWTLLHELCDPRSLGHAKEFKRFTRVDISLFDEIHTAIAPRITREDTNFRQCVTSGERLAITLRFLATGDSYPSLQALFRVSVSTICKLIPETCQALIEVYSEELIILPETEYSWKQVANRFSVRWNFHNTLGCVDGKHIRIKKPAKSKIAYRNYKGYDSIIFLAICDADLRFMYIEIGAPGRRGDAGLFRDSALMSHMHHDKLNIPPAEKFPFSERPMPYFMVGDDAFALRTFFMKPYPSTRLTPTQRIFNYRLSRCRRCIECAFGTMAAR